MRSAERVKRRVVEKNPRVTIVPADQNPAVLASPHRDWLLENLDSPFWVDVLTGRSTPEAAEDRERRQRAGGV